jgi:hypothetical protein
MCHGMMIESETGGSCRPAANRFVGESGLHELLFDPIAQALMAADKVDSSEVYALLRKAQGRGFTDSVR